jgi:hypothetical protein
MPTVEPWNVLQGTMGVPPPRLVLRLWLPYGRAERAWRGRLCASTAVAARTDARSGLGRWLAEPRV